MTRRIYSSFSQYEKEDSPAPQTVVKEKKPEPAKPSPQPPPAPTPPKDNPPVDVQPKPTPAPPPVKPIEVTFPNQASSDNISAGDALEKLLNIYRSTKQEEEKQ